MALCCSRFFSVIRSESDDIPGHVPDGSRRSRMDVIRSRATKPIALVFSGLFFIAP
jgi:hypothetical protein